MPVAALNPREMVALMSIVAAVTRSRRRRPAFRALATAVVAAAAVTLPAVHAAAATTFTFQGRGWGHGVGMSQWGAKGLADQGWPASRILPFFYRGTAVQSFAEPGAIRVGLLQEQPAISVTGNGRFDFYASGSLRASGQSGETWSVKAAGSQLTVSNGSGTPVFSAPQPVSIRWQAYGTLLSLPQTGHQYTRDRIDIEISSTGKTRAVAILPFEQYLYGLGEMPASWSFAALETQAVAGRTYALEKVMRLGQSRPVCDCGVYGTVTDQVYAGASQEVGSWITAVNQTAGKVVTYNAQPIQAFYSASDGGFTENNENVWGGTALPYLRGACDPGDYDNGANPNANWTVPMNGDQIAQKLQAGGFNVGSVTTIEYLPPRGVSGRILRIIDATHGGMRVTGASGTARISGDQFAALVGLKSTLNNYNIAGAIRLKYDALNCAPGLAATSQYTWHELSGVSSGIAQDFAVGRLFGTSSSTVHWTKGAILARYDQLRSQGFDLGLPTTDEFAVSAGRRSNFQRGWIVWNASTGQTTWGTA